MAEEEDRCVDAPNEGDRVFDLVLDRMPGGRFGLAAAAARDGVDAEVRQEK
jgi:hypothetical protein